jgi:hypothetical protein
MFSKLLAWSTADRCAQVGQQKEETSTHAGCLDGNQAHPALGFQGDKGTAA